MFQTTFPQGERRSDRKNKRLQCQRFNPRSRKGNDRYAQRHDPAMLQVSIHVPARGTTHQTRISSSGFAVSIHVPARGTTIKFIQETRGMDVSIHVPARGTTLERMSFSLFRVFQSTFPQGERRYNEFTSYTSPHCFNPRSRKGNDGHRNRHGPGRTCFNPRSRKGNDAIPAGSSRRDPSFNPRSRKGNDTVPTMSPEWLKVSIHVPARGTTRISADRVHAIRCFNPRSRKGNDTGIMRVCWFSK